MTPEERFKQIENLLHYITGLQARHDEAIAQHNAAIAEHNAAMARHDAAVERNEAQLEKQNAGIQDLIRISRTLVDSQTKAWEAIHSLSGKLETLTDNVNRFIAGLQRPSGSH